MAVTKRQAWQKNLNIAVPRGLGASLLMDLTSKVRRTKRQRAALAVLGIFPNAPLRPSPKN